MDRHLGRTLVAALVAVVGTGLAAPAASAAPPPPKKLVITAAPATAVHSQTVRLTVAITPRGGGAPKGGTITFLDGSTPIGTAVATTRNTAVSTSVLDPGTHSITASYSGDAVTAAATSAPVTVTVGRAPTSLSLVSDGPVTVGEQAEMKATVRAVAPAAAVRRPVGTVTFTRGSARATVRVNTNGVATWRPLLPVGDHPITATFDGSEAYEPSGPASTTQTVEDVAAPQAEIDQQSPAGAEGIGQAEIDDRSDGDLSLVAELVTPHVTGDLTQVGIRAHTTGEDPLLISIQTAVDGVPTGTVLGTGTLPPTGDVGIVDVTLDAPVPVSAGTQYAIVFDVAKDETGVSETTWMLPIVWAEEGEGNGYTYTYVGTYPWDFVDIFDVEYRTWVLPAA